MLFFQFRDWLLCFVRFVLLMPESDISLYFRIRLLKILKRVLKRVIQHPTPGPHSIACPAEFLKQNNRVSAVA